MKKYVILAVLLFFFAPAYAQSYTVDLVIDCATLELSNGEHVRLIGIDCLESRPNPKLERDVKRTGQVEGTILAMRKEATEFVRGLGLEGKEVRLAFDVEKRDKYGRLLAYVYIPICLWNDDDPACGIEVPEGQEYIQLQGGQADNGIYNFVNATIVKSGYAQPTRPELSRGMTIPPNVKYADLFEKLYQEARKDGRGLWKVEMQSKPVFCTMEVKLCPDGSYVGRVAPNCEFKKCPE